MLSYFFLAPIPIIPILFWLIDGKQIGNFKRGVLQIAAFVITGVVTLICLGLFDVMFALSTPILLALFILIFSKVNFKTN